MSAQVPLRLTQQITVDHWVTICRVCPKRLRNRSTRTEQASDEWWAQHVQTEIHKRRAADDGTPTAEDELIARIFGVVPRRKRIAPRDRNGALTSRPHVTPKWSSQDNPRGDTP